MSSENDFIRELEEIQSDLRDVEQIKQSLRPGEQFRQDQFLKRWIPYCQRLGKDQRKHLITMCSDDSPAKSAAMIVHFLRTQLDRTGKDGMRCIKRQTTICTILLRLQRQCTLEWGQTIRKTTVKIVQDWIVNQMPSLYDIEPPKPKPVISFETFEHDIRVLRDGVRLAFRYERLRIQTEAVYKLSMYTTARIGSMVESKAYYGTDEAICYRDIEFQLIRNEAGDVEPYMVITMGLYKGQRSGSHQKPQFTFHWQADSIICLQTPIIALAILDDAFEDIRSVEELLRAEVVVGSNKRTLRWKPEWKDRPVFRAVPQPNHPYRAWVAADAQIRRLSFAAGHQDLLSCHATRRSSAIKWSQHTNEHVRRYVMGHKNAEIYQQYMPTVVQEDPIGLVSGRLFNVPLGTISEGLISISAPTTLEEDERRPIKAQIQDELLVGSLSLNDLQRRQRGLESQLLSQKREAHFRALSAGVLFHAKQLKPYPNDVVDRLFYEYYYLKQPSELDKVEILNHMIARSRKGVLDAALYTANTASSVRARQGTEDTQSLNAKRRCSYAENRKLRGVSLDEKEVIRLAKSSTCFFCFHNTALSADKRSAKFKRCLSDHLAQHRTIRRCPHPDCLDFPEFADEDEFRTHLWEFHSLWTRGANKGYMTREQLQSVDALVRSEEVACIELVLYQCPICFRKVGRRNLTKQLDQVHLKTVQGEENACMVQGCIAVASFTSQSLRTHLEKDHQGRDERKPPISDY